MKPDTAEVPTGWEKHEDDEGAYYWHIATGTIQREMPTVEGTDKLTAQHKRLAMPTAVAFRNKVSSAIHVMKERRTITAWVAQIVYIHTVFYIYIYTVFYTRYCH